MYFSNWSKIYDLLIHFFFEIQVNLENLGKINQAQVTHKQKNY